MSKETAIAALNTLTDEEAELLNSDAEMLGAFKKKHGIGETSPSQPNALQQFAEQINIPSRIGRAAAVGLGGLSAATGISPLLPQSPEQIGTTINAVMNPSETIAGIGRALGRGAQAFQPGFQPAQAEIPFAQAGQTMGNIATGATLGMATGGLSLIPSLATDAVISGGLSAITQAQERGRISPLETSVSAAIPVGLGLGVRGAAKGVAALVDRGLAPFLKSQKGLPIKVTQMALEDPTILNEKAVPGAIKDKVQVIINTFKEAQKKVRESFGKTYRDIAGMNNPVDEFIADLPTSRPKFGKVNYEVPGPDITKTNFIPGRSYQTAGDEFVVGINPSSRLRSDIKTSPGEKVNAPGRSYSYTAEGPNVNVSRTDVVGTTLNKRPSNSIDQLKQQYADVLSGDFYKTKNLAGGSSVISDKEKLVKLTQLKRELQAQADYMAAGQEVGPNRGVIDAAIKKMAADVDEIRGKIPGGDELALADDAYLEMKAIKNHLKTVLKDSGSQIDYLNRIIKGNIDWLTAGKIGQKFDALKRIEEITGKEVVKPALQQMAIAYLRSPDILGLPSLETSKWFQNFIPKIGTIKAALKLKSATKYAAENARNTNLATGLGFGQRRKKE